MLTISFFSLGALVGKVGALWTSSKSSYKTNQDPFYDWLPLTKRKKYVEKQAKRQVKIWQNEDFAPIYSGQYKVQKFPHTYATDQKIINNKNLTLNWLHESISLYWLHAMLFTCSILFRIISSTATVTSSVITGAGLTLCSKSRSTSRALFFGLFAAVTCPKPKLMCNRFKDTCISQHN